MRLSLPDLDFSQGFSSENDIFHRKYLAKQIEKIINFSCDDSLVLALDDKWGSGKTTFIKMWQGEIDNDDESKVRMIYFNAFENDYQNEPFLALSAKVYEMLDEDNKPELKSKWLDVSKKVAKSILSVTWKASIAASTAGILRGSDIENATDKISEAISDPISNLIEEKFKSVKEEEATISNFIGTLKEIANKDERKIIFIIDELDRARPDYALELIEKIKHLFSMSGVFFLLVMNREQFEKGIQKRYGDINASIYLSKFIHLWIKLPQYTNSNESLIGKYIDNISSIYLENCHYKKTALICLTDLLTFNSATLRDAERCLTIFSLLFWECGDNQYEEYFQIGIGIASYLKVMRPDIVEKIHSKTISYREIESELNLKRILSEGRKQYMMKYLKREFMNDDEFEKFKLEENEPNISRFEIVKRTLKMVDNLSIT